MARPRLEGTNYKMSIHVANGHRYASTQPLLVDQASGKTRNMRIHWGTYDCEYLNSIFGDLSHLLVLYIFVNQRLSPYFSN